MPYFISVTQRVERWFFFNWITTSFLFFWLIFRIKKLKQITAWKVSKYGVISGPYFPVFGLNTDWIRTESVFSPNTGKYEPETTPYLDIRIRIRILTLELFYIFFKLNFTLLGKGVGMNLKALRRKFTYFWDNSLFDKLNIFELVIVSFFLTSVI